MHEQAIIDSIIQPIENIENLKEIHIELGELAGITPDHLKEHLSEKIKCNIIINPIDSVIKCLCGYTGRARIKQRLHDYVIYDCQKCGLMGPEIIKGKDIKIIKLIY